MQKNAILLIALVSIYVLVSPVNATYLEGEALEDFCVRLVANHTNATQPTTDDTRKFRIGHVPPTHLTETASGNSVPSGRRFHHQLGSRTSATYSTTDNREKFRSDDVTEMYLGGAALEDFFKSLTENHTNAMYPTQPTPDDTGKFRSGPVKATYSTETKDKNREPARRSVQRQGSRVKARHPEPDDVVKFINKSFPQKYGPDVPKLDELTSRILETPSGRWELKSLYTACPNVTSKLYYDSVRVSVKFCSERSSGSKHFFNVHTTPHSLTMPYSPMELTFVKSNKE